MSFSIRRSLEARRDLSNIWLSIALHDEDAANRLLDRIEEVLARLAEFPHLGARRDEIAVGLRGIPKDDYLITYQVQEAVGQVVIKRVIHGRRDIAELFRATED